MVAAPQRQECSALHLASKFGRLGAATVLLQADPSGVENAASDYIPLQLSTAYGHVDLTQLLVKVWPEGVQVQCRGGFNAVHFAVFNNSVPNLRALLRVWPAGVQSLTQDGATPLHLAAVLGEADLVEELLAEWPEALFVKTAQGHTPPELALRNGQSNIVRLLKARSPRRCLPS